MNKIYFFIFFIILGHVLPAQQSSLVLTGLSRPSSPYPELGVSGNARSFELYVLEDIPDLSVYGFATSNSILAGANSTANNFQSGSFSAGDFIYITRDLDDFEDVHGFSADQQANLNYYGGADGGPGPYCVVEILYFPNGEDPQTIDFWASNGATNYNINGGWAKRNNCFGPNAGPTQWQDGANVFESLNGALTDAYSNFNIFEWTYEYQSENNIVFGTYNNNCVGCTDELALEYSSIASIDDGSCQTYLGCDDAAYLEYYTQGFDPSIVTVIDNGSCLTPFIPGCQDNSACNYNAAANYPLDEQCIYTDNICETCVEGQIIDNDSDDNGICDWDEINCNVSVQVLTTNLCEGDWEVYFDFQYTDEIEGLEGVSVIFTDASGNIVSPDESTSAEFNSLYDIAYIISTPGDYTVTFDSNSTCPLPSLQITILESVDVDLSYEIESIDCEIGLLTVYLDGPSGIYSIYVNDSYYTDLSIGLDNIEFNNYNLGDGIDCLGNDLGGEPGNNQSIAFTSSALSNLGSGDQIGAFFIHPTCGLTAAHNYIDPSDYNSGSTVGTSVWGDDSSTGTIEGFLPGQEIIWLINSGGTIYSADITWSFGDGNYFAPGSPSAASLVEIGSEYSESFDIQLPPDSYGLSIYQNDCLISAGNDNIVDIIDNDTDNDGICDELEITGCTDETACNYNPSATEDNGSCDFESCVGCIVEIACNYDPNATIPELDPDADNYCDFIECAGCLDETACNYDDTATLPDGSCEYPEEGYDCDGNCLEDADLDGICDNDEINGCTDITACNYDLLATDDDGSCYNNDLGCGCDIPAADEGYNCDGDCLIGYVLVDGLCVEEIEGCTDPTAFNFDESANTDDGSCEAIVLGCTDDTAFNFDESANTDDGLCEEVTFGCSDVNACNYDGSNTDDGTCEYETCEGCMTEGACNYCSDCTIPSDCDYVDGICDTCSGETDGTGIIIDNDADNDGICDEFDLGCIDDTACNFDINATTNDPTVCNYADGICDACSGETDGTGIIIDNDADDDGICDSDEILGCTDFLYEEYDPLATEDNGSCVTLSLDGCIDDTACNFNINATDDDGSCLYLDGICETCVAGIIIDNDADNDGICDDDEILGCTDLLYEEYNPLATDDDGSCLTLSLDGCTDPTACNYNVLATDDDGSCEFLIPVSLGSTQIITCNPSVILEATGSNYDSYLWNTGATTSTITVTEAGTYSVEVSIQIDDIYECFSVAVVFVSFGEVGCIDSDACNFDPDAECSSPGACEYDSCAGCTSDFACNYDPDALYDDGTCDYLSCAGCTEEDACNYDPNAIISTDCEYDSCAGCLEQGACNYDPNATISSDCEYESCLGCTDPTACDYDPDATILSDCEYESCLGCTDLLACNYELTATIDDNSCEYITCAGCIDLLACNYDSTATLDDDTCLYLDGICETCEEGIIIDNDADNDGYCDDDEIFGCTDFLYEEYNPLATENDGSCLILSLIGCTDQNACNYNANATTDNGSCIYADDPCEECFGPLVLLLDFDGDGVCNDDEIEGCIDPTACNYNESATDSDDCIYPDNICESCSGEIDGSGTIIDNDSDDDEVCDSDEIEGCLEIGACNYNPLTTDEVPCLFADEVCEFCTDEGLVEFLDIDGDGVCDDDEIFGCTDPLFEEFNPFATEDDGSCIVLTVYGCTDSVACNYNIEATDEDGSCEFINYTINVVQPCEEGDSGTISLNIDPLFLSDSLLVQWTAITYAGESIDLGSDSNSLNLTNLPGGIYTYNISNNICSETDFVVVFVGENIDVLDVSIQSTSDVSCFIDENNNGINDISDGFIQLDVTGGFDPYTYLWSNGSTSDNISNLSEGVYSVTVTDNNGCVDELEIIISEPDSALSVSYNTTIDCLDLAGVPDGQINLTVSGGTPPYQIQYDDNGDGIADDSVLINDIPANWPIYPLDAGLFDFAIQDANGCLLDTLIELDQNDPIDISYSGNPYNCYGDTNAFLDVVFSGGTPPYSYILVSSTLEDGFVSDTAYTDGEVIQFENLITGDYFISCTDALGCTQYSLNGLPTPTLSGGLFYIPGPNDDPDNLLGPPTSIVQVGEIDFSWNMVDPLECFGDSAAYIDLEISQSGDFTSTTFNVYVDSSDVTIDTLVFAPETIDLEFCYYAPTNANASGVLDPSNGPNFATDSINLLPGDIFGLFQQVTPNTQAASGNLIESGYMCVGGFNSSLSQEGCSESYLEPTPWTNDMSSGAASPIIVWFAETATSNDGVIPPGAPSFISGDSENIVGFVQRLNGDGVLETYPTTINFNSTIPAFGDSYFDDGAPLSLFQITSIIVGDEPVSGEGGGETICIINPSFEDEYEFTVVDQYGCSETIEINIPTPQEPINVNIVDSADYNGFGVSCNGNDDGFFNIVVSGGLGDYTVSLYSTLSENGLEDMIGNPISSNYCPSYNPDCLDIINSSEFDPNFNFSVGSYYITVTDTLGCSNIENGLSTVDLNGETFTYFEFFVSEPDILEVSSNVTNVSCNGLSDGSVEIIITGGAPPYSINPGWTDSDIVEEYLPGEVISLSGFAIGDYQVSIEDANYCFVLHEFSITEPDELVISLISVSDYDGFGVSCSGAFDGDIEYLVTGGTPLFSDPILGDFYDLTFLDENGNLSFIDPNTPNLPAGIYTVFAVDANGCTTDTLVVELTEPDGMELLGDNTLPSDYISNYNGFSVSCSSGNDGQIGVDNPIEITGGIGPFIYTWYIDSVAPGNEIDPTWFGADETSLDGIAEGVYVLVISDLSDPDGCELELPPFVLDWPDPIGLSIDTIVDYNFDGVQDWSDSIQFDTISIDAFDHATGNLLVFGDYGVPCNGSSNGFINIDVTNGVPEYFYQWEAQDFDGAVIDLLDQTNNEDLDSLSAGIYTVMVTDQNFYFNHPDSILVDSASQCYVSQTFILEEPISHLEVDVYVHQFSNNSFSEDYEEFVSNPDTVLYQDGEIIEYGISCFGDTTGLINVDISGGTGTYTYKLMLGDSLVEFGELNSEDFIDQNTINLSNQLSAGNYILYVSDSNYNTYINNYLNIFDPFDYEGCYFEMEIIITEPDEIIITYDLENYNGYNVSCFGIADAFIDVSVSGGIGNGQEYNYIYSWEGEGLNGQNNTPDINGISAGTYTLTVYDNLYFCQKDTTIVITTPDPIEFELNQLTYSESCFNISCFIDADNDGINDVSDGEITVNAPAFESAGLGFSHYWTFNDTIIDFDNNTPSSLFPSINEMSNNGFPTGITGLSAGYYHLYVQDDSTSCDNIFGPIFISEPQLFSSNIDNVTISDFDGVLGDNDYNGYSVSCANASDGIISVEIEGGSGIYDVIFTYPDGETNQLSAVLDPQPCEIDLLVETDIDGDGLFNWEDDDIDGDGEYDNNGNCISNCNNAAIYDFEGDCLANCSDNDNLPYYAGPMSTIVELAGLSAGIYSIAINDGSCQPLQLIDGIELISPPEILVLDSDLATEELDLVITSDVSCAGGSDGSITTNFIGGLPNNWNWGLYYSGTDSIVYLDDEPVVGVNLIEPGEIVIQNLPADSYDLFVYDINGFYVTDDNFANLGLSADSSYLYFNDGCYASQNNIIIYDPLPIDTLNFSIIHPCFNDLEQCDSTGSVSFDLVGDNSPFDVYIMSNSDTIFTLLDSFEDNVIISNLVCGDYQILVQDANNCESLFDISIGFGYSDDPNIPMPILNPNNPSLIEFLDNIDLPDCDFSYDGSIILPDLTSGNVNFGFDFSWSAVDLYGNLIDIVDQSANENLENLPVGIYSLHITDTMYSYCPDVVYDYILEAEYDCPEVPTAFSPNGDGINDYWVIGAMEEYIDAEIQVYNRWGDLVFYSERNSEYWDGTYKGKKMPAADYFYIIKDVNKADLSHGRVTLRR